VFHDGQVNVVSAAGAAIAIVFFTLLLSAGYLAYQVYFKGVTHFEIVKIVIPPAQQPQQIDIKGDEEKGQSRAVIEEDIDDSATPVKAEDDRVFKRAQDAAAERQARNKQTANKRNTPAKSPGKRGPVGHDDIEFEIIDPQPTEDDI
jgi:hypothetical protein